MCVCVCVLVGGAVGGALGGGVGGAVGWGMVTTLEFGRRKQLQHAEHNDTEIHDVPR